MLKGSITKWKITFDIFYLSSQNVLNVYLIYFLKCIAECGPCFSSFRALETRLYLISPPQIRSVLLRLSNCDFFVSTHRENGPVRSSSSLFRAQLPKPISSLSAPPFIK